MRYYCHHCQSQISAEDLLPDFTCPNCQSGFVEEITISHASRRSSNDQSSRDDATGFGSSRMSSDEYSDDNSDAELMEAVGAPLAQLFGLYERHYAGNTTTTTTSTTSTTTTTTTITTSNTEPTTTPDTTTTTTGTTAQAASTSADPSNPLRFLIRASVQSRGGQRSGNNRPQEFVLNEPTLANVLTDFINGAQLERLVHPDRNNPNNPNDQTNSGGVQTPAGRGLINIDLPLPLFLHSSPGDYAWGNAGFDAVITQLLNNLDGTSSGPRPMTKEEVDKLPTVSINEEQVKKHGLQCTVCMEDFQIGESARQLPCEHSFHQDCILPWLAIYQPRNRIVAIGN